MQQIDKALNSWLFEVVTGYHIKSLVPLFGLRTTLNFRDCKYLDPECLYLLHVVNISCILPQIPAYTITNGLFQKNPNREGWGHGISRGIEEIACASSRAQLKNSHNFWGDQEKIMWNFQGSLFLTLEYTRRVTQVNEISGGEALLCLKFPKVKWQT